MVGLWLQFVISAVPVLALIWLAIAPSLGVKNRFLGLSIGLAVSMLPASALLAFHFRLLIWEVPVLTPHLIFAAISQVACALAGHWIEKRLKRK